jgi:hypothetical protein
MTTTARAYGVAAQYPASQTAYKLSVEYVPTGQSTVTTTAVTFYVDDINAAPVASNVGITADTVGTGFTRISGVPSLNTTATLKAQWCQTNCANYFLQYQKKHANVIVTTSGGTTISSSTDVLSTSMGASHKYYSAPTSSKYGTSSALHNTSGLVLAATSAPEEIQFSDFTIVLSGASSVFDEACLLKITPYSAYSPSGATAATGSFLSTSDGSSKNLRVDTKSIAMDRSSSSYATNVDAKGQHVSSGTGTTPDKSTLTAYDHTQSLLSNSDLQLVNGTYQTPKYSSNGYKNYTSGYWLGSYTSYDYTTITNSASTMRYVTFKYSGLITSGQSKMKLTLVHSGLACDLNAMTYTGTVQVLVDDTAAPMLWCDTNLPIAGSGLGTVSPVPNGTTCGDVSSTAAVRNFYIVAGASTSAVVYIRIGAPQNVSVSITSATLQAVTTF